MSPETAALLQAGKLEQCCPSCGRWEAAGWACSWCSRPMSEADWYRNGDEAERAARMPASAPANPPSEYRRAFRPEYGDGWPPQWGPNPFEKPLSPRGSRINEGPAAVRDSMPAQPGLGLS